MSKELKKENKLYDLSNLKETQKEKCKISKEDLKKIKIFFLILFGILATIFLFGGYIFQTYNIEYSNTAFEKQDLNDCYIK